MDKKFNSSASGCAHVEDYQEPSTIYAGIQAGKTTEYIARNNAERSKQGKKIKAMNYKGRYE